MVNRFIKSMAVIFTVILMLSLIGCSSTNSSKDSDSNQKVKTTEVKKEKSKKGGDTSKEQQTQNQPNTPSNQESTAADTAVKSTQNTPTASTNAGSSQTKASANSSSTTSTKNNQTSATANSSINTNQSGTSSAPAQSGAASASETTTTPQPPLKSVKLTIIGPKERPDINRNLKVNINDGDTVLDVLKKGIGGTNVICTGSGAFAYVKGILGISEKDYGGPASGWTYSVNGTSPPKSAGAVQVKAGDQIEWKYKEN